MRLCAQTVSAREATRLHNDANILALGGRVVGPRTGGKIVDTFLNTEFFHERETSEKDRTLLRAKNKKCFYTSDTEEK